MSFFLNIYEHIINRGLGFIVLAQHGPRPIAAAIFFRFGRNALYKYGASDKRFQALRANNLVMWEGIQFLARNGAEKLHFGRTEQENEGLRRFKLSWNTQEETIDYFRVDPSGRHVFSSRAIPRLRAPQEGLWEVATTIEQAGGLNDLSASRLKG